MTDLNTSCVCPSVATLMHCLLLGKLMAPAAAMHPRIHGYMLQSKDRFLSSVLQAQPQLSRAGALPDREHLPDAETREPRN